MSLWNDDPYVDDDKDERPFGWGLCGQCGCDCEEDDYDDGTKTSTCPGCREAVRIPEAERGAGKFANARRNRGEACQGMGCNFPRVLKSACSLKYEALDLPGQHERG